MSDATTPHPATRGGRDTWTGPPGQRTHRRIRPRGRPIDILAALSGLWQSGSRAQRERRVQIAADKLHVYPEKRTLEMALAQAVAAQIHQNILAGRNPSGRRSKPLKPRTLRDRASSGPRGVATGQMSSSIRVEEREDHVVVTMTTAPGQYWRAFRGARWTYNPSQPVVAAVLNEILDFLVPPTEPR